MNPVHKRIYAGTMEVGIVGLGEVVWFQKGRRKLAAIIVALSSEGTEVTLRVLSPAGAEADETVVASMGVRSGEWIFPWPPGADVADVRV